MTNPFLFINRGERIFNPIFQYKGKSVEMLPHDHRNPLKFLCKIFICHTKKIPRPTPSLSAPFSFYPDDNYNKKIFVKTASFRKKFLDSLPCRRYISVPKSVKKC